MPGGAFDFHVSLKRLDAFAYALKPEMSVTHARCAVGIESTSVVSYGEEQPSTIDASCDLDVVGATVSHGIDSEFSHNSQNCVENAIRKDLARSVEAHLQPRTGEMLLECSADGLVDLCVIQGETSEVPDAVAQFGAA